MAGNKARRVSLLALAACLMVILCGACAKKEHVYEARGNVVVLLYHTLLNDAEVPAQNLSITTNAEKFENDLITLIDCGYQPISLNDLYENKNDKDSKYFAITFDDGYLSNYEIAYPILQKHQCYADIFINTDNEYMEHHFSFEQAGEMEASGLVTIHSHFPVHEDVREYSDEDFLRGLQKSLDTLNEKLGPRKYDFFAYPYGGCDEQKYTAAEGVGVDLQFVQERILESGELIIRTNVAYDTDIARMLDTVYLN